MPASGGCFDTVHLDLWVTEGVPAGPGGSGPFAFFHDGAEYEDEAQLIDVDFETSEWIGREEGSFTSDVRLTHACLGPDPVPHRVEITWSFTETWEEIENGGGPSDPDPVVFEL